MIGFDIATFFLGKTPTTLLRKNLFLCLFEKINLLFNKERIICLLRYGPKERFDGSLPEDFDFLLLLDKYQKDDYSALSFLKKMNLPIELFIDYKDQILSKGIENYQEKVTKRIMKKLRTIQNLWKRG